MKVTIDSGDDEDKIEVNYRLYIAISCDGMSIGSAGEELQLLSLSQKDSKELFEILYKSMRKHFGNFTL